MPRIKGRRARKASEVFHRCPRCESPNVFTLDGEVFCSYCNWNSVGIDAPIECRTNVQGTDLSSARRKEGSLVDVVEKLLGENPFLTNEPCFA